MIHQSNQTTVVTSTEQAPKILKLYLKQQDNQKQQQQQKKEIAPQRHVTWTEDTINNEGMNKMKSNLCCIYHRPGEGSSDTCTSDDEGNALQRDRGTKKKHKQICSKFKNNKKNKNSCGHNH